ncbi:MAG TPA: hypothetical protein VF200_13615 [Woeseiaceae bacterium]
MKRNEHETARRLAASPRPSRWCALLAAACGATVLGGAAAAQERAHIENTEEITATVTAIEPETRLLTLRGADGNELVVEASDQVRNFEQIEVGDQVDVSFYEALVAEVTDAPPSSETGSQPVVIDSRRAPLGEKPGGAVTMVYTAVVTINAVDPENNVVNFTGPGGQPRQVAVVRPEMQKFIKTLNPGDRVQVTYGEALAVAVRPAENPSESPGETTE